MKVGTGPVSSSPTKEQAHGEKQLTHGLMWQSQQEREIAAQLMHVQHERRFYGKTESSEKSNMRKNDLNISRMLLVKQQLWQNKPRLMLKNKSSEKEVQEQIAMETAL